MKAVLPVIAIEGASYSGKSSAIAALMTCPIGARLLFYPEYTDLVATEELPALPHGSAEDELGALAYFLDLDVVRMTPPVSQTSVVSGAVLDRSYHSLLAHVYASDRLFGRTAFRRACAVVQARRRYVTDLTLYLDVPRALLRGRCPSTQYHGALPFLLSDSYCSAFRAYFVEAYIDGMHTLAWIDGAAPAPLVVQRIESAVMAVVSSSHA